MIFTGVHFGLVLSAWFQWMLECVYVLLLLWKWAFHKPYLISCEGELVPEIWTGQFRIEFPWGLSLPLSATLVVLTQPRAGPRPGPDPHHRRHLRGLDSVRNSFWSSSVSSRKTAVIAKRQSDCDCPPVLDSSARAVTTVGLLPGAGSRVAGLSWLQDSARCEKHRAPQRRTDASTLLLPSARGTERARLRAPPKRYDVFADPTPERGTGTLRAQSHPGQFQVTAS